MITTKNRGWTFPSKTDSLNVSYDVFYNEITQIDNDVGLSLKYIFGSQINYFLENIADLENITSQALVGELALILENKSLYKFESSHTWVKQVSFGSLPLIYNKDPIYANYKFSLGQIWVNTSNGKIWYIVDNTEFDAIWISNFGEISAKNIFKANVYLDKPLKDFFIEGKLKYRVLNDIFLKDSDTTKLYSSDKKILFGQIKADKNKTDYFLTKDILEINSSDDDTINEDFRRKYVCVVKALLRLNSYELKRVLDYFNEKYNWIYMNVPEIVKNNDKLKAFEKLLYDMNSIYNITDYMMDYNININELKFKNLTFREDKFLNFEITNKNIDGSFQAFLFFNCRNHEMFGLQDDEEFGSSVAVDESYIYVGRNGLNANRKLTIFNKSDYSIVHELYGSQDYEGFGSSVAVDDNYIYVGSPDYEVDDSVIVGKLTIFNKSDYSIVHELFGTQDSEGFGSSVAVDEKYLYVGSPWFYSGGLSNNGKLIIYNKSDYSIVHELYGTQNYEHFGASVAVDDNYIYVGSPDYEVDDSVIVGKLSIFNKSDYNITHELYGTQDDEYFGFSVSVDDNYIYVGSPRFDSNDLENIGKLTIFNKSDYSIVHELYGTRYYEYFGCSVAVDESYIYVGSKWFDSDGLSDNGKLSCLCKNEIFEG